MDNNNQVFKPIVIAQSMDDYMKDQRLLLRASIEYEGAKKLIKELKTEVATKDALISILKDCVYENLEMFESIFDTDENAMKYEDLEKYLKMAEYMEHRYNRRTPYIRRVKERMNKLPY